MDTQCMLEYFGPIFRIESSPYFLLCLFKTTEKLIVQTLIRWIVRSAVVPDIAGRLAKLF